MNTTSTSKLGAQDKEILKENKEHQVYINKIVGLPSKKEAAAEKDGGAAAPAKEGADAKKEGEAKEGDAKEGDAKEGAAKEEKKDEKKPAEAAKAAF